jgi:tetratricopeptide (TPR) repeat protein
MQNEYAQVQQANERQFKKLNISIGDFDKKQLLKLTPILQSYTADYCNPRSKIALLNQVSAAGFVRLAAQLANDHYAKCAKHAEFLELGYAYNKQLGEYSKALEIINLLIDYDPANPNYRFSRGKVYEDTKSFAKALMD